MLNKTAVAFVVLVAVLAAMSGPANAGLITWKNAATDWNTDANWNGAVQPDSDDVAVFDSVVTNQPALSDEESILSLWFKTPLAGGWTVSTGASKTLTLGAGYDYRSLGGPAGVYSIYSANISGTNTISAPVALGATQSWYVAFGGTLAVSGAIGGGSNSLTKLGGGTLTLSAANTYTGATTVNAGTLTLSGANGALASTSITISSLGTLTLDNTTAKSNRLPATAAISMNRGTFTMTGTATESVGGLTVAGGHNTLTLASNNTVTFSSLTQTTGSYGTLGWNGTGTLKFTSAPSDDGIITGWAFTTGSNGAFLTRNAATGVVSALTTGTRTQVEGGASTDNVYWLNTAQTALSVDTSINSLAAVSAFAYHQDLGGHALNIGSGGLLKGGSAAYEVKNGTLTAGGSVANSSLYVINTGGTAIGPATISAKISDNPGGAVNLVVTNVGTGDVVINNHNNDFTGNVFVNAGVLQISTANEVIPDTAVVTLAAGAALRFYNGDISETIAGLDGSPTSTVYNYPTANNATLHVKPINGTPHTFSGTIAYGYTYYGSRDLAVVIDAGSDGTQTLSGPSFYSLGTTIGGGTLIVGRSDRALATGSASASTDYVTLAAHNLSAGDPIAYRSAAAGGLTQYLIYYVRDVIDADTVTLSASRGGAMFNITADFSDKTFEYGSGLGAISGTATTINGGELQIAPGVSITRNLTFNNVVGSKLTVNGSYTPASGTLIVPTNGTLGGSGAITAATTVNGHLAPGSSVGTLSVSSLTLAAGSYADFQITGNASDNTYDQIDATSVTYAGTLNVSFLDTAPTAAGTYTLFDVSETSIGSFATVALPDLPSTLVWHDYGTGDYFSEATGQIQIDAVPEPATMAFLALGGLALAGRLIRRRRSAT